ncbi:MAG: hypothetical protein RMX89_17380 [Nostoc sp. DedSLP04]|nr:hypothetical protein [Nostoc sp. DedSLP04]
MRSLKKINLRARFSFVRVSGDKNDDYDDLILMKDELFSIIFELILIVNLKTQASV